MKTFVEQVREIREIFDKSPTAMRILASPYVTPLLLLLEQMAKRLDASDAQCPPK